MPLEARVTHVRIVVNKDVVSARVHQPLIGGRRVAVVVCCCLARRVWYHLACAFPGYPDFLRDVPFWLPAVRERKTIKTTSVSRGREVLVSCVLELRGGGTSG